MTSQVHCEVKMAAIVDDVVRCPLLIWFEQFRSRFKNQVEQVTSRFLTEGHKY